MRIAISARAITRITTLATGVPPARCVRAHGSATFTRAITARGVIPSRVTAPSNTAVAITGTGERLSG